MEIQIKQTCLAGLAAWSCNDGRSVGPTRFGVKYLAMKLCTDIHGAQKILELFSFSITMKLKFFLFVLSEIFQQISDVLP